ncbi:hypothetical protein F0562_023180 [Nyssa sinensis]|uniref:Protein YIP n=1 Tax=Nyssa sinensis TaxID=561372 RepID=A0A5J5BHB3_9ASTE|nr:hypothetical protein F0562_023180 [Nyssa sinensis]
MTPYSNSNGTIPIPVPRHSLSSSNPHLNPGQNNQNNISESGLTLSNTLTEPVWDTMERDLLRIFNNLKLVVLPNPFREDPGKALRDWDLWGPFFFVVFLGLTLSWSASIRKSEVFAAAFAVLAAGAIVLTLNVLLLGGRINFFQSISLLGYCLFPLDIGALICMFKIHFLLNVIVASVTSAWSSWAAYPFTNLAVKAPRKALALYPVLLMYISVGFLIIAIG